MNQKVQITSSVWNKNSKILYDYHSAQTINSSISISKAGMLNFEKNQLHFNKRTSIGNTTLIDDNRLNLGTIDYNTNRSNFVFNFSFKIMKDLKAWLNIEKTYSKNNCFRLKEGDYIKFGKVVFKIKEIFVKIQDKVIQEPKKQTIFKKDLNISSSKQAIYINSTLNLHNLKLKSNTFSCRICLTDEYDLVNPMLKPCKCSGTMKFIHLNCLKQWVLTKVNIKDSLKIKIYKFKNLECELCKFEIPDKIRINNEIVPLIDLEKPKNSNYIVIENINTPNNGKKYIYVIDVQKKSSVLIGRSNNCDITLTDTSISKSHAKFIIDEDGLSLCDSKSKFGTLIRIENQISLLLNRILSVQITNFLFTFKPNLTIKGILCCNSADQEFHDYSEFFIQNNVSNENVLSCEANDFNQNDTNDYIKTQELETKIFNDFKEIRISSDDKRTNNKVINLSKKIPIYSNISRFKDTKVSKFNSNLILVDKNNQSEKFNDTRSYRRKSSDGHLMGQFREIENLKINIRKRISKDTDNL